MRVASSHASRALQRPAAPRCMRSFRASRTVRSNVGVVEGPRAACAGIHLDEKREKAATGDAQSRSRVPVEERSGCFNGDERGGARVVGEGRLPGVPQGRWRGTGGHYVGRSASWDGPALR